MKEDMVPNNPEQPTVSGAPSAPSANEVLAVALAIGAEHCDANGGNEHTVITQGRYRFCANCGETIGRRILNAAEAKRAAVAAIYALDRLRADGALGCQEPAVPSVNSDPKPSSPGDQK